MKINIEDIKSAQKIIDDFNNLNIKDVELFENNKRIDISENHLNEWRFIGLCNSSFVDVRFWEEKL